MTRVVQTLNYTYDEAGNRKSMSFGATPNATYDYDALNRLTQIKDAANSSFTYAYDATDKVTTRTMPNGITTSYAYDGLDRLTQLADVKGVTAINANQYQYNAVGNITQLIEQAGTRNYAYDALDRLTSAIHPSQPAESYVYDGVGNRTNSHRSTSYMYQPTNRLQNTATAAYAYDNNGNLTSKTDGTGTTTYTWDYENRLVAVTIPAGTVVTYKYDALGRRVERRSNGGQARTFIYDGQEVVRDVKFDGSTVEYINGLGTDEKLRQSDNTGTFYFTADYLGSTTALTDASGNVVERLTYDSFGDSVGSNRTRYDYTGRERDKTTNLIYYRARWYDPQTGRFLSEDPIGFAGGINMYAYVENNPINFTDPMGLELLTLAEKQWMRRYGLPQDSVGDPQSEAWRSQGRNFPQGSIENIDPYGGAYRHCVAACLLKRNEGLLGMVQRHVWDFLFEDSDDPNSRSDMQAEDDGFTCADGKETCEQGCLRKYPPLN